MDKQRSAYRTFIVKYQSRQPVIQLVRTVYLMPLSTNRSCDAPAANQEIRWRWHRGGGAGAE
jgi:hypothetical protein